MEKETGEEGSKGFSRREILQAALTAVAAAAVLKLVPPKSRRVSKESVIPKATGLPTVGHEVTLVPAPVQESTPGSREEIVPEVTPQSAEEERESSTLVSKERVAEQNILGPSAFTSYANFGGELSPGIEILDFFPQSYQNAPDSLQGLWGRAIEAKTRENPHANASLAIELETLPDKVSFDYLLVPEGTKFFDVQEQKERILPCGSNVIIVGKIDGEENLLAVYQEPVNNCYYFAKVSEDSLSEQDKISASKNLIVEAFNTEFQNLKEVGTPEERARLYEVEEGDSLDTIASHFGLPSWHCVYGKNLEMLEGGPKKISPGQKLQIPNRFGETEFINGLVVGENTLSRTEDLFGPKEAEPSQYFPETQHSVKEPFLSLFKRLGFEVTGPPISEATPGDSKQYFRNLIVEYGKTDGYDYIPGRPKLDGVNPGFFMHPLGWSTYFHLTHPGEAIVGKAPEIGQFFLEGEFESFYNEKGGIEIFGYPVSSPIERSNGEKIQYLTNCALSYTPGTRKVAVAPLTEEFLQGMSEEQKKYPWFEPLQPEKSKKIFIDQALEMVGVDNERLAAVEARAVALMLALREGSKDLDPPGKYARDKLIFDKLVPGQEISFNNIRLALIWYEARFKMNPALNEALSDLKAGGDLINKIFREKVSPSLFKEDRVPELPDDWQDVFVFLGGGNGLAGGEGADHNPILYGNYDEYRGDDPGDKGKILTALVESGLHESIHSFIQTASKTEHSQWWSKEKPEDPNVVPADARKGLLAHMSMCILTSAAQKHYGFEEKRDPRINYILKILKQGEVGDPEAEVIRAAATFNGDSLWGLYEKVRGADNPSMDSLMSTQNPDLTILKT